MNVRRMAAQGARPTYSRRQVTKSSLDGAQLKAPRTFGMMRRLTGAVAPLDSFRTPTPVASRVKVSTKLVFTM